MLPEEGKTTLAQFASTSAGCFGFAGGASGLPVVPAIGDDRGFKCCKGWWRPIGGAGRVSLGWARGRRSQGPKNS